MVILSDPLLLWAIEVVNDNTGLLLVPVNVAVQFPSMFPEFPLLIPQPTRTSPIATNMPTASFCVNRHSYFVVEFALHWGWVLQTDARPLVTAVRSESSISMGFRMNDLLRLRRIRSVQAGPCLGIECYTFAVINGTHLLLYSENPEADRAFFRDILNLRSVDAGGGWLIFQLPPAEIGIHPGSGDFVQMHAEHPLLGAVLYLMCDDLSLTMRSLQEKSVACTAVLEAQWGLTTTVKLPSGGSIGLYQPKHPTAIS